MSTIQVVTQSSPDFEALLPKFEILARQVFEPEIPESEYRTRPSKAPQLQPQNWRIRLNYPDAAIFYAAKENDASDEPHAFFMVYPRALGDSKKESYYIYLAAVHPSARGQGLFPRLLEATKAHARETGYETVGVGTIPSRFKRMYAILSMEGSGWEEVEWKDAEEVGVRKVVMRMAL